MSGVHEVTAFLGSIGLDVCVQAVVHNGFYTSMEALKGATYEELLDCLSARLKADTAMHWAKETLMRVPYFNRGKVEDEFLASAALTRCTGISLSALMTAGVEAMRRTRLEPTP